MSHRAQKSTANELNYFIIFVYRYHTIQHFAKPKSQNRLNFEWKNLVLIRCNLCDASDINSTAHKHSNCCHLICIEYK